MREPFPFPFTSFIYMNIHTREILIYIIKYYKSNWIFECEMQEKQKVKEKFERVIFIEDLNVDYKLANC